MARKTNKAGLDLIKSFEGCRLTAYKVAGANEKYYTIGWGHYGPDVKRGMKITQAEADQLLKNDLKTYEGYVEKYCNKLQLNDNQFSALVSFCYNCGAGSLQTLVKGRTVEQIGNALLLYNKAGGNVMAGLVRRRKAEQALFNKGVKAAKAVKEEYDMKTIKKGSKGKAVKIWQIIIGAEPDGIYGADTEKLTKKFQKKKGLTADGIVGSKSWKAGLESVK